MANKKEEEQEFIPQVEKERNAALAGTEEDRKEAEKTDKENKTTAANKERRTPKRYDIDTFSKPLNKEEEKEFNKLDKDEQKKFIIKKWIAENKELDTPDMHEVSLADEAFVGYRPS
ncbi:hypothetical protein [Serratia sp. (in: enterobacteria)]|uniref:hypothetical protein n=1 Tax=Serratia sp. (in: enterobacteria) TaxID=616 RepID=UPI003989449E